MRAWYEKAAGEFQFGRCVPVPVLVLVPLSVPMTLGLSGDTGSFLLLLSAAS
ncbi:MAG: hypothetical protein U0638_15000 [Phycisphaerales bacterium]